MKNKLHCFKVGTLSRNFYNYKLGNFARPLGKNMSFYILFIETIIIIKVIISSSLGSVHVNPYNQQDYAFTDKVNSAVRI